MALVRLCLRLAPARVLAWLDRRGAPLGERVAALARREGTRRWMQGRSVHDQFIPF
jgi:hypothetical protein